MRYKQISRMASFHFRVDTVKSCCKILCCPLLCGFVNTTNLADSHPILVRCVYIYIYSYIYIYI